MTMKMCRQVLSVMFVALLFVAGCGGTKAYVPPEGDSAGTVVITNDIFNSGFYVEVDKQDAGFLRDEITLVLKPGKHTIKVFNSETIVGGEDSLTTEHTFRFKMKVDKGSNEEIVLSWDDPNYDKDVNTVGKSIRPDKEDKPRRGMTAPP